VKYSPAVPLGGYPMVEEGLAVIQDGVTGVTWQFGNLKSLA
jgi:hypothetical protein